MCGILIWLNKQQEIEPNKFSEALKLLSHRGPDTQQMLFFESLETIPEQLYFIFPQQSHRLHRYPMTSAFQGAMYVDVMFCRYLWEAGMIL